MVEKEIKEEPEAVPTARAVTSTAGSEGPLADAIAAMETNLAGQAGLTVQFNQPLSTSTEGESDW